MRLTSAILFFAALPAVAQVSTVIYQGKQVAANQIILRLRSSDQSTLARIAGKISDAQITPLSSSLGVHVIKSTSADVARLISTYVPDNDVVNSEPNYIVRGTATPNDAQFSQTWGLQRISAPQAWDTVTGSNTAAVAVIDSGIDYTHPDLAANVWSAPTSFTVTVKGKSVTCPAGSHGYNMLAGTCDPKDDNGHGTHIAGTIGAVGNNSIGVAGVNWSTKIMAIKFLDASGNGTLSDAIQAIDFAIQAKAVFANTGAPLNLRVISASWGGDGFSLSMLSELFLADANKILFVTAAGNDHTNNDATPFYPANYASPNIISVAAVEAGDVLTSFSNYGAGSVHLAAPGADILSTVPGGGYAKLSGTSMSTPHVTGAALLTLGACPALDNAQLKSTLVNSVDVLASLTGKLISNGRLNVNKAIQNCLNPPAQTCIATVASDHWKGEYFNNLTFTGSPLMVRDDGTAALNFNWGSGGSPSASCSLPGTAFSVRWTRSVTFSSSGTYRFTYSSDDGIRLYIDGVKVLDRWFDQAPSIQTVDLPVTSGTHALRVEYYQNAGGDSVALDWSLLASSGGACINSVSADHWKGEYFNNVTLSGTALMVRDDGVSTLNFNWDQASPSASCGLARTAYSVRWTRAIAFPVSGTYRFTVSTDDGMRLYIDGQKVWDRWFDQAAGIQTIDIPVTAGIHSVVMEYYQNAGGASAALNWQLVSSVTPLTVSAVSPGTVTVGSSPTLTVTGTGFDATFRAFLISGTQTTEIFSKTFISATSLQVTPAIGGTADASARLQITVGTQSASIGLPIVPSVTGSCIGAVAVDHWRGEYFNNMTLSGTPLMVRDDGTSPLNFNWGSELSPNTACNLPGTAFSVRWTATFSFTAGTYRFTTSSDDGMRLYVDGVKVLDRWYDQAANVQTADTALTGGAHTIVVEYYQNKGGASAAVNWVLLAAATPSCVATVAADHWKGEYFNNMVLSGTPVMVRDDGTAALNFNWGGQPSPSASCNVPGTMFSVRWTRTVTFTSSGTYRFTTSSDDGMRLYVDGVKVLDRWFDQASNVQTTDVPVSSGVHTIVLEYYQNAGGAVAAVTWAPL